MTKLGSTAILRHMDNVVSYMREHSPHERAIVVPLRPYPENPVLSIVGQSEYMLIGRFRMHSMC